MTQDKEPHYLYGKTEKCYGCNGRGYTSSENHPECPLCSGSGYLEVSEEVQP